MKTPSLKLPHINVNKKLVLITAGLLIVLALFSFAVVKQTQAERQDRVVASKEAARRAEADRSQKVRIASLEQQTKASSTSLTALSADKATLCASTKSVVALRAARVAAHCQ